tara:strand:- start:483 stop:794 length:312 start_codon:yes stop_codon:yes gene_type:complete
MIKIVLIFLTFIILNACESAKEGFTLQKQNRADEFLVKKKNPLVLPPKFGELPSPEENAQNQSVMSSSEIKKLLTKKKNETKKIQKSKNIKNIEENILEKIKD